MRIGFHKRRSTLGIAAPAQRRRIGDQRQNGEKDRHSSGIIVPGGSKPDLDLLDKVLRGSSARREVPYLRVVAKKNA